MFGNSCKEFKAKSGMEQISKKFNKVCFYSFLGCKVPNSGDKDVFLLPGTERMPFI